MDAIGGQLGYDVDQTGRDRHLTNHTAYYLHDIAEYLAQHGVVYLIHQQINQVQERSQVSEASKGLESIPPLDQADIPMSDLLGQVVHTLQTLGVFVEPVEPLHLDYELALHAPLLLVPLLYLLYFTQSLGSTGYFGNESVFKFQQGGENYVFIRFVYFGLECNFLNTSVQAEEYSGARSVQYAILLVLVLLHG